MRISPPPLDIADDEGFTPEKDLFNRAATGRGITNLLSKVSDPLVIAVDGQWGSGKTTFLKMWAGELRKLGFPVVYFDAFANDYFEDAFAALADAIVALAEAQKKTKNKTMRRLVGGVARVSKVLGRSALRLGVKAATLGALDVSDLKEAVGDISGDVVEEASQATDALVDAYLEYHREQRSVFEQFHKALTDLPEVLAPKKTKDDGEAATQKPLVFIIDELDRCRPHFALQVLERIKHFFSVPNVHFVLGAHLGQLRNSVSATYGAGVNAQVYLEKFINLTVHLVDESEHAHDRNVTKFINRWLTEANFKGKDKETSDAAVALITHVAERRDLSFRTIDKILTNLALAIQFTPENYLRLPAVLAGLCIMKVADPEKFVKAKTGALTYEDVIAPLCFAGAKSVEFEVKWWRHCLGHPDNEDFGRLLRRYGLHDPASVVPALANRMVDFWGAR